MHFEVSNGKKKFEKPPKYKYFGKKNSTNKVTQKKGKT